MKKHKKAVVGLVVLLLAIAVTVGVLATRTDAPPIIYVIKPRDTLALICKIHKVSVNEVVASNPGLDPRRLRVGQELLIPNPPLLVRLGRTLDKIAAKVGIGNPPFERTAYNLAAKKAK